MQAAIKRIKSSLKSYYPETEISSFSYLIISKITGFSRTEILVNKNTVFSAEQSNILENIITKLQNYIPIQYILGETEFLGLTFHVNDSVLIPRPETEELVDWIRTENDNKETLKILDIGTGSGCIAVSLKNEFPNSIVTAFDISEKALETAHHNADLNKMEVIFSKVDILKVIDLEQKWDIIVSNPPYVTESEKTGILANVLNNEPHLALFVPDNNPLLFYKKIAGFAQKHLLHNGKLYFEINREFGQSTLDLLYKQNFSEIKLRKDMLGNDRMIRAIYK